MQRRHIGWTIATLVAAVVAVGAVLQHAPRTSVERADDASAKAVDSRPPITVPSAHDDRRVALDAAAATAPATPQHLPTEEPGDGGPTASLVRNFASLLTQARQGDPSAIRRLNEASVYCDDAPLSVDAAVAKAAHFARAVGQTVDVRPDVEWFKRCEPLRGVMSAADAREILLLAAQAGLPFARERYIDLAYRDALRDEALPEEMDLYRANARSFLDALVAEGSLSGLSKMSAAYTDGKGFRRDPVKAAAYMQALVDMARPEPILELQRQRLFGQLTAEQREAASALAAEITADFVCRDGGCAH